MRLTLPQDKSLPQKTVLTGSAVEQSHHPPQAFPAQTATSANSLLPGSSAMTCNSSYSHDGEESIHQDCAICPPELPQRLASQAVIQASRA